MMRIFTIIVTYNAMRRNWIDKCLSSLEKSTMPTTPVIVDNASRDETLVFISKNHPNAVCLPQKQNLGFGQANNVGIRYAIEQNADHVLLLNQDATIAPNTLELMISHGSNSALLSPIHMNGQGTGLDISFRNRMREIEDVFFDDIVVSGRLSETYTMKRFPAACWLLPTSVIRKIGGFNPLFFHYGEDDNYLERLAYHNIPTFIVSEARMWHDRGEHGNMTVFNKNKCYRMLLIIACNINNSTIKIFVDFLRILFRCYAIDLPHGEYRIGTFCKATGKILSQLTKIIQSRKKEKILAAHWL